MQITTGADPTYAGARYYIHDYRLNKQTPATATVAGAQQPGGYCVEALIPWMNLPITPKRGSIFSMQLWMTDSDKPGDWFRTMWYAEGWKNGHITTCSYPVRLSDHADPPMLASYTRTGSTIHVFAAAELAGQSVLVKNGGAVLARGQLAIGESGRAEADLSLPATKKPYTRLKVRVGSQSIRHIPITVAE